MRIASLRLQNFRQHAETQLEFDDGLTGIIGPNGSGKTTILEAIAWALYGTPAARGTRDSIRHHRAPPRASVKVDLEFDLGGHRYRVVRGLTTAELYLDGGEAPIANSLSAVSDQLRRKLGMTREEFFNTYFTGQKELSVMAALGPADRAQFLSRVLGYDRLRAAQGLARDQRKMILAEGQGLRAAMPDPAGVERAVHEARDRIAAVRARAVQSEEQRRCARATLDDLTPRWEALNRERDALTTVLNDLRVAENDTSSLMREAERLIAELAAMERTSTDLRVVEEQLVPLASVASELEEQDRRYREAGRRAAIEESERALAAELSQLDARRAQAAAAAGREPAVRVELEARRSEFEQTTAALEAARTEYDRDKQEAKTKRDALLEQLREVKHQRELLVEQGEDGTCPTCARPLGDHFRAVLELLDSQIETITVNGKYFRQRMEQLAEVPAEVVEMDRRRAALLADVAHLERRLAQAQAGASELAQIETERTAKDERLAALRAELAGISGDYDPAAHADLRARAELASSLQKEVARLRGQLERREQVQRDATRAGERVEEARRRVAALQARRAEIPFVETDYAAARTAYEGAAAAVRDAELAAVAASGEIAAAEGALASAEQAAHDLARMQEKLAVLATGRRLHDELDRAYGDIRADLNADLRPEISEVASGFLAELTDGRYSELELDQQYEIVVHEDGIPKPVISGGEEDLANLVLRLAISQMIAERAGQSFSLLILDEIFGSLDEARRHNVVELLRRLQDRFEQVILITHIESVRDGLDQVIGVRYDEEAGSSRVEVEKVTANVLTLEAGLREDSALEAVR